MADRTAPRNGYDFGNKRQYRRTVWRFFADHCPVPRAYAQALLMPSLEGDEIEVALNAGFREYNLHIVDRNPAIVATLKRRYPQINTYGVDLVKVLQRIPRGTIHVANLDLCSTLNRQMILDCQEWAGHLAQDGLIAVTFLRGRDSAVASAAKAENAYIHCSGRFGETDMVPLLTTRETIARAAFALRPLPLNDDPNAIKALPFKEGRYQSSSPMGWIAGRSMFTLQSRISSDLCEMWIEIADETLDYIHICNHELDMSSDTDAYEMPVE